jgi:hypothetical protein
MGLNGRIEPIYARNLLNGAAAKNTFFLFQLGQISADRNNTTEIRDHIAEFAFLPKRNG